MARQYHRQSGSPERYKTISFYRSYHGATMGALTSTGWPQLRAPYEPLVTRRHPRAPADPRLLPRVHRLVHARLPGAAPRRDRAGGPAHGLGGDRRAGDADGGRARALGRLPARAARALRRDRRAPDLRRDRDRVRTARRLVRGRAGGRLARHPLRRQGPDERVRAALRRPAHREGGERLLGQRRRRRPVPGGAHVRREPRLGRVRPRRDPLLRGARRARQRRRARRRARGAPARDRGALPDRGRPARSRPPLLPRLRRPGDGRPARGRRSRSAPRSSRRRAGAACSSAPPLTTRRSLRRSS